MQRGTDVGRSDDAPWSISALSSHGVRLKRRLRGGSNIERLELLGGQSPQATALELMLEPSVEFAEPNFLIRHDQFGSPDDPEFGNQWSLRNIGQSGGQFGSDINVSSAWQTTTGSTAVPIAVIDSGIDFTHPDLVNNRWHNPNEQANGLDDNGDGYVDDLNGWDFIAGGPTIIDQQGHGTAIAGIIAAQGNNGIGMSGVMWRSSLMSLRVLDGTGTGDVADAAEAIDFAVSHGALVINLSWGTSAQSLALKRAIERATRRGVVVVCSAGNNSQDLDVTPYYPASFRSHDLLVVAASDNFDQLTSWSNWADRTVSIAAPGLNILTTQIGGGYAMVSGTSASAPMVSGVAGLLKSANPWLDVRAVAKAITDGSRQVTSLSGKVMSEGVLDASGALQSLRPYGHGNGVPGGLGPRGARNTGQVVSSQRHQP